MRTSISSTTLAAALLLAAAGTSDAGGGRYMGGGGGGMGSYSSGGFGGGGFGARGMSAGSGPTTSVPSASYGSRPGSGNGGRWNGGNYTNGGHGNNWHGGKPYGGYWYGGWYYPYWYWPAWGATIAVATTWPYWTGTWVDPYYYPYPAYSYPYPTYQYYGPPSGTIIYRDGPGTTTPGAPPAQQMPQQAPQPFRLYCPATNQYYPDVGECTQQWLKVVPNDGAAPTPQSGPAPTPQSSPQTSSAAPRYVYASSTTSASVPITSGAMRVREPGTIAAGAYVGNKIPAPRMDVPSRRVQGLVVAESRAE